MSVLPEKCVEHSMVRNSTGGQNCFWCGLTDLEIATGVRFVKPKEDIKNDGLMKQKEKKEGSLDKWT